ncbi:hypothetical protein [Enterococcus faecium]|uniref:hypothetical protein n=1 Tax=Enterococcus faecium TaxID=1352 RepID=UPI0021BF91D8
MFLWLKTLYRKRAVTWPFIFYTIIWTLSSILKIELKKENNKSMKISKKAFLLVVLILLSTLYSVNFMRNAQEIYTTGDLSFHLSRIKGLSSIFEGPINYTTFNNYGDGLNYFYPFLTIIPAVVFYGISNNLILSYVLYIWLLNICTILISFYYGEKFFKKIVKSIILCKILYNVLPVSH